MELAWMSFFLIGSNCANTLHACSRIEQQGGTRHCDWISLHGLYERACASAFAVHLGHAMVVFTLNVRQGVPATDRRHMCPTRSDVGQSTHDHSDLRIRLYPTRLVVALCSRALDGALALAEHTTTHHAPTVAVGGCGGGGGKRRPWGPHKHAVVGIEHVEASQLFVACNCWGNGR